MIAFVESRYTAQRVLMLLLYEPLLAGNERQTSSKTCDVTAICCV